MKYIMPRHYHQTAVRPLAGAGIEIASRTTSIGNITVRPLAGAGIEMSYMTKRYTERDVRPLAGAGIEIA